MVRKQHSATSDRRAQGAGSRLPGRDEVGPVRHPQAGRVLGPRLVQRDAALLEEKLVEGRRVRGVPRAEAGLAANLVEVPPAVVHRPLDGSLGLLQRARHLPPPLRRGGGGGARRARPQAAGSRCQAAGSRCRAGNRSAAGQRRGEDDESAILVRRLGEGDALARPGLLPRDALSRRLHVVAARFQKRHGHRDRGVGPVRRRREGARLQGASHREALWVDPAVDDVLLPYAVAPHDDVIRREDDARRPRRADAAGRVPLRSRRRRRGHLVGVLEGRADNAAGHMPVPARP
mmetsp:Transcript_35333/g.98791  ORF Transcript_35333/g.98791 Transcript_35333/m.98791 type:complete len:290 (-) Transcript_35333:7-876(-)